MPRISHIAREARRAVAALSTFPESRGNDAGHFPSASHTCPYCSKTLKSAAAKDRHIILKPYCRERHLYSLSHPIAKQQKWKRKGRSASPKGTPPPKQPKISDEGVEGAANDDPGEKICTEPFVERFPVHTAGAPISNDTRPEPNLHEYIKSCGTMGDRKVFDIAELLMMTIPKSKDRTRHLQSAQYKGKTPWRNNRDLLKDIDSLPHGPGWESYEVEVGEGAHKRVHVGFRRDVIDVVKELIGNTRFKSAMRYAPEQHWTSSRRKYRVYSELWTGNWWWRMQYLINARNKNGTVAPLIAASDVTTLSRLSGGQQAYPVYLTIGNISKSLRRKPTSGASMVVGYLPVDTFKDVKDDALRLRWRGELVHKALAEVFAPLKDASEHGVPMWCADGRLRHVYPMLASWVGDWPEQNDISCTIRSGCPICKQKWNGRGSGKRDEPMRHTEETLAALRNYRETKNMARLRRHGLKPWWPFWAELPDIDIANCITPDLLHQLHKGIFKTHLMGWLDELITEREVDARFKSMPCAQALRHFKRGINTISQWTGREIKEMMKQFLPVVAEDPGIPDDFVEMVRALLDFTYLAHSARLTDIELREMDQAFIDFHRLKTVIVELGLLTDESKFDYFPKLHMIGHYAHSIREFGTPDGYNTETPEYLHIEYAKKGWQASNRRNPIPQIILFVQRREAIKIHRAYLDELYGERTGPTYRWEWGHGADMASRGEDGDAGDDEDDGDEDDNNEVEGVEIIDEGMNDDPDGASEKSTGVAYPRPERSVALRPTRPRLRGSELIQKYGATDLLLALRCFLAPVARAFKEPLHISPNDRFDTWHKISLYHLPLPFAPDEPLWRDVIRAQPPEYDSRGRIKRSGIFDTALFLKNPAEFGIHRYRAGRVRTIFTLPPRLQHLHTGPLAYVETFTRFDDPVSSVHHMHIVSHACRDGHRHSLVIPVTLLTMACHLAPLFCQISVDVLESNVDTLEMGHRFFLNHHFNYFLFHFVRYWRQLC